MNFIVLMNNTEKLNIYIFLYERFADFEIVQALLLLRDHNLHFVAFDTEIIESECKFKVKPDLVLEDVNSKDVDVWIIPGGDPKIIIRNDLMKKKSRKTQFNSK